MKSFFLVFCVYLFLSFGSIAILYGYEEGTMQNDAFGNFAEYVVMVLKFPFAYLVTSKYLLLTLLVNGVFWAAIISVIHRKQ